jgi:predicted branched-subunit amino acid permease
MSKKVNLFFKGIVDVLPLLIPVVPFGVIVGAIGIELGFTPLETYATSLIIFGGASQIVFLQLFSGGASSIITISSTFVVNSRHLLYGASLSEYLNKLTIGWKLLLSYLLTDQAYAVSNIYFEKNKNENLKHFYLLGSGFHTLVCLANFYNNWYFSWINCTRRIRLSLYNPFDFYFTISWIF